MTRNLYNKLHRLYDTSKTLRFELKPMGKTLEYIERDGILQEDEYRAKIFKNVKKYCDEYHKFFIEQCLSNFELSNLDKYFELFSKQNRDKKEEEEFKKIQSDLRKEISNKFKKDSFYKGLFGKEIIK